MKSILCLTILSSIGLLLPNKVITNEIEAAEEATNYLVLTTNGLYNGEKGQDNDTLFLENVIEYTATVGSELPGSDMITNSVSGVTFNSWVKYDGNGVPTSYTTVGEDGDIFYASWDNDGTAGVGSSTSGGTQGGGNQGGDNGGGSQGGGTDTGSYTWYIVGSGSFVNGATWNPSGGIGMTENLDHPYSDAEFMALSVSFTKGDIWKICKYDQSEWIQTGWESQAGSAIATGDMKSVGDGYGGSNIEVNVTGTYDIYLKLYNSGTPTVWIQRAA